MAGDERRAQLSERDVRAMVRLLGDVATVHGDIAAKKRQLMQGLSGLIDADMWACAIATINNPQRSPMLLSYQYENITPAEVAAAAAYAQDHDRPMPENCHGVELIEQGIHWTRRREQLVSDQEWYDPVIVQRHREMGYDDYLYSAYPLTEHGTYSFFGFYRRFGRACFTDRDCRLVHIIASEVDWLHYEQEPAEHEHHAYGLPPRLRTVFTLMLDGWDRKSIARELDLSPHTIGDYMKQIYQHFNVDGHVELLRRFMAGADADASNDDSST